MNPSSTEIMYPTGTRPQHLLEHSRQTKQEILPAPAGSKRRVRSTVKWSARTVAEIDNKAAKRWTDDAL